MALSAGTKLGPYEVISALGAGGMGEVYRARDTRLGREVAIKVLPKHLSSNPESRERFEREARAISSLNHPHICTLHDVGHQDGVDFLVMEYLEGETLADRMQKGALPLKEALRCAIEIAEALEKAHKSGIVHRDLKPGNVMLTKQGAKLLDFGLAKPAKSAAAMASDSVATMSKPLTGEGVIVGTYQYMAPEQIQGREPDPRTDIFAFGAMLYEMVTGRRAFQGQSQISVMSAILEKEPEPIAVVQPLSPALLDDVVRTCLEKNPADRYESAHDLRLQLKKIAQQGTTAIAAQPALAPAKPQRAAWAVAALLLVIAIALALSYWRLSNAPQPVWKSELPPPEGQSYGAPTLAGTHMALSPDGRKLAFIASSTSGQQLWVRRLDSLAAQPLPGTQDASYPFWSPDGRAIGFFAQGKLKRVNADGGPVESICEVATGRGGSWNKDGTIIFTPSQADQVEAVSASGGTPRPATQLDKSRNETSHRWPWFLPDGRHFLYTVRAFVPESHGIYVGSLASPERKLIARDSSNAVYASGYLLFIRENTLVAQRFDLRHLELEGEAFPLAEKILFNGSFSNGAFTVSENDVLAYRQGTSGALTQIVWFDRSGKGLGEPLAGSDTTNGPVLSPDGKSLVYVQGAGAASGGSAIWMQDLARKVKTRFSFTSGFNFAPVWSADGKQVAFGSGQAGSPKTAIYLKPADGSKPEQVLLENFGQFSNNRPLAWSPDGRFMLFRSQGSTDLPELWALPLFGDKKPFPVMQVPSAHIGWGDFSPDGKWITYESDESGRPQIYVAPFPGPGAHWQVSSEGGTQPLWRGNEIFFLAGARVWSAEVHSKGSAVQLNTAKPLTFGVVQAVAAGTAAHLYDVSRDGKRFVVSSSTAQENSVPVTLVLNWPAELKK